MTYEKSGSYLGGGFFFLYTNTQYDCNTVCNLFEFYESKNICKHYILTI